MGKDGPTKVETHESAIEGISKEVQTKIQFRSLSWKVDVNMAFTLPCVF